ncbi:endo-1,4-beta-xylanase z precursor-like protein [Leishmania mexicana MHOM/GT/2001/U1103]|uniref:Endo-1,4-beta-xylanase z-like protein n=1 Tax=Leishmania mexicana (strain MHOM/GT/2001/U1103) TaxID=929439 RepID=E9AUQ6_LEIMU|nr:endo-1,4-beta-xylanase z precursor-like protein [Leishmania mexicana MHOM/GT/2001/U1103]CBZ26685.1 endo-1,4-beta-xylanase z precursor-like protein [Leishmania mexicana MHOM/GT/2001/U1103]
MSAIILTLAALATAPPSRTPATHLHSLSQATQPRQHQLLFQPREEGVAYSEDNNGTVHYRFYFPHASSVVVALVKVCLVNRDGGTVPVASIGVAVPMTKHQDGMWVGTMSAPVGLQCVVLMVDGNPVLTPYLSIGCLHGLQRANYIDVPPPNPNQCVYAVRPSVEHGIVAHNYLKSYTMDTIEEVLIYLPPSYHKASSATRHYPVLYLLHDDREYPVNCVQQGKVNVIADNLIADGKMTEMIIVMKSSASPGANGEFPPCDPAQLCEDLTEDIIPYVDNHYRTEADRDNRAIAGLYMGSIQVSRLCMTHHDLFAYAGMFSGFLSSNWNGFGTDSDHIEALRHDPSVFQAAMKVLFRCIGDDTTHRAAFEADDALLAELGVACERRIYVGSHSWEVWRQAAADFLPMLFKGPNFLPRH